jgi:ketosteroid isomerase-like protein
MCTNVEIVRNLYEAWNRGDTPSALALIDPEIEVEKTQGGFNEGTYRGHAGLSQVLQDFWDQFEFDRSEVKEYMDAKGDVLTAVIHHGRGKGSGIEVEMWHWNLWTLRDGKIVRLQLFLDRAEAMRAAGLVRGAEP